MNIMILGHKYHGKTAVAQIMKNRFNILFEDTTLSLLDITKDYVVKAESSGQMSWAKFLGQYYNNKDSVRHIMVEALADYNKINPARFINEQYTKSDIYAGCRSQEEYNAAKPVIDFTLWVRDNRKEENDPTMKIQYEPHMIVIDNSGTLLQLEANTKKVLYNLAGIDIRTHDVCLRDSIVSNLAITPTLSTSIS